MKEKYSYYYKKLKRSQGPTEEPEKEGSRKSKIKVWFTWCSLFAEKKLSEKLWW